MKFRTLAALTAAASLAFGAAAVAQDRSDWPNSMTIGTASQGGTYFVYGNGFASYIAETLGIAATGEVTGGPVQNVTLVETGDHLMGLVTMGPAYDAWNGNSELGPRSGASFDPCAVPDVSDTVSGDHTQILWDRIGLRSDRQARVGWSGGRDARHLLATVHGSAWRAGHRLQRRCV